jgi:hypothetical protein
MAQAIKVEGEVDPMKHLGQTLWCVYGFQHIPFLINFKLATKVINGQTIVELHHRPKNAADFVSLGRTLDIWRQNNAASSHNLEHWFIDKAIAEQFLADLVKGI